MALKAGYIGIKKSMLGLINSLASAKLIKSFGDGLNLTNAGKLNMTAATASKIGGVKVGDGLEITGQGVLNCTVTGGFDYSSDEFDTGQKWIDEKTIYGKVFHDVTIPQNAFTLSLTLGAKTDIDKVLYYNVTEGVSSNARVMDYRMYATISESGDNLVLSPTNSARAMTNSDVIVLYTKNESSGE